MRQAKIRNKLGIYPDTNVKVKEYVDSGTGDFYRKTGSRLEIYTTRGYEGAIEIIVEISDVKRKAGIFFPPCEIPIAIHPVNCKGWFYTRMPPSRPSAEECDKAPIIIVIEKCYRYDGMNDEGGHVLTKLPQLA
ncbi:MAG: hypothetical protein AB7C98_00555 [Acidithiobacillus sp.]